MGTLRQIGATMRTTLMVATFAALIAPAQAYAAKYRLDLTATGDQKSRMNSGVEGIDADLPGSSVRVLESEEPVRKRGTLLLYVLNAGGQPVNFGPENVSIQTDSGVAVAVIPYERLLKEEKNRQTWAAIAAGLSAAANSYNASMAGNSYGTVNAYGSGGGWATANYSAYNPAAAWGATSIANAQNQQMFDRLAVQRDVNLQALRANMRTSTIDPGRDFGGQVTFELPKLLRSSKQPIPIRIKLRIGDEEHLISGSLIPTR